MSKPTIRDATTADAPGIAALVAEASIESFNGGPREGREYFLTMNSAAAILGKMQGGYRYYVAEDAGRLVGMIAMLNNAHIYHLFIAADAQRRGLGQQLWEHARAECLSRGNRGRFTVFSTPNAVGFYERCGFAISGGLQTRNGLPAVPMKLGT